MPLIGQKIRARRELSRSDGFIVFLRESFRDECDNAVWAIWRYAVIAWLFLAALTPFVHYFSGISAIPVLIGIVILAHYVTTVVTLWTMWRFGTIALSGALMFTAACILEATARGYAYTPQFAPQLIGLPLVVPFLWMATIASAWGVADMVIERRRDWLSRIKLSALAGLAFAALAMCSAGWLRDHGLVTWPQESFPWRAALEIWAGAAILTLIVRPLRIPRFRLATVFTLAWCTELYRTVLSGSFSLEHFGLFAGVAALIVVIWAIEYQRWRWTPVGVRIE
jgi:hypothetical protein